MGILLLAALILVPMAEIAVFIQVGGVIGLWPTLALVLLTAMAGSWQLRTQGLATLERARQQFERGVLPARELFDGLCLLVAGALLLTPGFVTDAAGLLLFLPPFRDLLRRLLLRRFQAAGETRVWVDGQEIRPDRPAAPGEVIDADYRDVTRDPGNGDQPDDDQRKLP